MTSETTPASKRVYIVGTAFRGPTEECFTSRPDNEFTITRDMEEADIFVFTGGEDIYPGLYGEKVLPVTHYNTARDRMEVEAYHAMPKDKPKLGICRGAQLLNVMNGGKMWQHVSHHNGGTHQVEVSVPHLFKDKKYISNSIHHQQMIPTVGAVVLAAAYESDHKLKANKEMKGSFFMDPEVVWYPETKSFCFQAHPEFGHVETHEAFFTFLEHLKI